MTVVKFPAVGETFLLALSTVVLGWSSSLTQWDLPTSSLAVKHWKHEAQKSANIKNITRMSSWCSEELSTLPSRLFLHSIQFFKSIKILVSFCLPKSQSVMNITICYYFGHIHDKYWPAPVIPFVSLPLITPHKYSKHKLKQFPSLLHF